MTKKSIFKMFNICGFVRNFVQKKENMKIRTLNK